MKQLFIYSILIPFLIIAPHIAKAKLRFEETKGLSIIDGNKFTNRQKNVINLGILNPATAIPFYPLVRNYMELPAIDGEHAAIQALSKALFRPIRPADTNLAVPSTASNRIASYFTPDMLGTLLATYLLEDPATSLIVKSGGTLNKNDAAARKKQLAINLFISRRDFKEKLAGEHLQLCSGKTYNSPAFDMKQREKICSERDITNISGDEIYSYLNGNFRKNINQVLNIFADKPDLIKVKLLLTVLWHKAGQKSDYWDFFNAVQSTLANEGVQFLPKDKQAWLGLEWSEEELQKAEYTIDDKLYPELVVKALANKQPKLLDQETNVTDGFGTWPDCCARSIKNFIMINFATPSSEPANVSIDVNKLAKIGASEAVLNFFKTYNDRKALETQASRDEWGKIQGNLKNGVVFRKGGELSGSFDNLFKALVGLLFDKASSKPSNWAELVKAIDPDGTFKKEATTDYGTFDMSSIKFTWTGSAQHYGIEYLQSPSENSLWKEIEKREDIIKSVTHSNELDSFEKLKWFELAQSVNPPKALEFIFGLKTNKNPYYYMINMNTGEQVERVIDRLSMSDDKILTSLLARAMHIPDTIRRITVNAAEAGNTAKLDKAVHYIEALTFDGSFLYGHFATGAEATSAIYYAIAKNLGSLTNLKSLVLTNLHDKNVDHSFLRGWSKIPPQEVLTELFTNLPHNKSLSTVHISYSRGTKNRDFDEYNAKHLDDSLEPLMQKSLAAFLGSNENMKDFRIGGDFPVTDEIISALSALPLEKLAVSTPFLSDDQIETLAKGQGNRQTLTEIALVDTGITDAGIASLDEQLLKKNAALQGINLEGNAHITDKGHEILENRYVDSPGIKYIEDGPRSRFKPEESLIALPPITRSMLLRELAEEETNQQEVEAAPREVWRPATIRGFNSSYTIYSRMGTYKRDKTNYFGKRSYSTFAYKGANDFNGTFYPRLNITYEQPLFIAASKTQYPNMLPSSIVRLQPPYPAFFTNKKFIPWNTRPIPSTWSSVSWRRFITGMKRIIR